MSAVLRSRRNGAIDEAERRVTITFTMMPGPTAEQSALGGPKSQVAPDKCTRGTGRRHRADGA